MPRISLSTYNNRGFTMVEMLIVLVIIAITLSLTFSGGGQTRESRLGDKARMDVNNIYSAEKNYKLDKGHYLFGSNTSAINSGLGLSISNPNFTYSVTASPKGFRITATRTGGKFCDGKTITLDALGGEPVSDCNIW